jgi:hypothetical protein
MQGFDSDPPDAQRTLDAQLAAMEATALEIEAILGTWSQDWCQSTVDKALASDVHRTNALRAAVTYGQLMDEVVQLKTELPLRLRNGFRKTAWRHLFIDARRDGTARIMADLDFGIWQHSGYKIPPAYEPTVSSVLARVTQLLRKYGYRPEFGSMAAKHRLAAPPAAIAPMEAYYRMATRLPEVVSAAEQARGGSGFTGGSWDRE